MKIQRGLSSPRTNSQATLRHAGFAPSLPNVRSAHVPEGRDHYPDSGATLPDVRSAHASENAAAIIRPVGFVPSLPNVHSAHEADNRPKFVVLTIGVFDGVHRGHQALLRELTEHARSDDSEAVVLTFDPHPRCVVQPEQCPQLLTTVDERAYLMARFHVDRMVVLEFTHEISGWSAQRFCDELAAAFPLHQIVVGADFAFGHHRQGNVEFLRNWCTASGVQLDVVDLYAHAGVRISSTAIRQAVESGDVTLAAKLLGHLYFMDGTVVHGAAMGHGLGFPTANLEIAGEKCIPDAGIYAAWARVGETWHIAAASIGNRPTFDGASLAIEAFLVDFDGDVYGENVRLAFVQRLREQERFDTIETLVDQMHADVAVVRSTLAAYSAPADLGIIL